MNPVTVSDSSQVVTLTFDQGLTANTDYLLRLIAKDNFGNCQSQFTDIPIHTLDNIPPVTLAMDVTRVTGDSAALQSTLNEPGTVYYMVLHNRAGAAICPTIDQVGRLWGKLPQVGSGWRQHLEGICNPRFVVTWRPVVVLEYISVHSTTAP